MLIRGISALSNSLGKTYRGGVDIKCKISTGKSIMGKKVEETKMEENKMKENKTEENAKVEELIKRKGSQDFAQDLAQVSLVPQPTCCWKWVGGTKGSKRAFFSLTAVFSA